MNRWYEQEFEKAVAKTKEWGLDVPECAKKDDEFNIAEIRDAFAQRAVVNDWIFPYDMAGECIDRHIETKIWLEFSLGLKTVLTVGEVNINDEPRYGATYEDLQYELENPVRRSPSGIKRTFDAHVWLTLPNFGVFDVVLPASICGDSLSAQRPPNLTDDQMTLHVGPESRLQRTRRNVQVTVPINSPDGSFVYRDVYGQKKKVTYRPMLVGLDFLVRSDPSIIASIQSYR